MERDKKGRFVKGRIFSKNIEEKRLRNLRKMANNPERIKKISENHARWNKGTKGVMKPNKTSFKIGKHFSRKTEFKKGHIPYYKNKIMPEDIKIKISLSKSGEKEFTGFKREFKKRVRLMKEYLKWRSDIFKRDNYHCQNCGNKGYLEAHHIIPFAILLKKFGIKTMEDARKCKLLWDIGNGISYCQDCHIKEDKFRGKRLCQRV